MRFTQDEMDMANRAELILSQRGELERVYRREFGHLVWSGDWRDFYSQLMRRHFNEVHEYLLERYDELMEDCQW